MISLFLNFLALPPKAKRKQENLKADTSVLLLKHQSLYRRDENECLRYSVTQKKQA
jgi:hypothetical protein